MLENSCVTCMLYEDVVKRLVAVGEGDAVWRKGEGSKFNAEIYFQRSRGC